MNTPPGLRNHPHCPRMGGCTAKAVLEDTNGKLWKVTKGGFVEHKCTSKANEKPMQAFLAIWYNKRLKTVRYIGPNRMERSVLIAPSTQTQPLSEWELREVLFSNLDWTPLNP